MIKKKNDEMEDKEKDKKKNIFYTREGKEVTYVEDLNHKIGEGRLCSRHIVEIEGKRYFLKIPQDSSDCFGDSSRTIIKNEITVLDILKSAQDDDMFSLPFFQYEQVVEVRNILGVLFREIIVADKVESVAERIGVYDSFSDITEKMREENPQIDAQRTFAAKYTALSLEQAVCISLQTAEQAHLLHELKREDCPGIILGDYSPQNSLIYNNNASITDFNAAHKRGHDIRELFNETKVDGVKGGYYVTPNDILANRVYHPFDIAFTDPEDPKKSLYTIAEPNFDTYTITNVLCLKLTGWLMEKWKHSYSDEKKLRNKLQLIIETRMREGSYREFSQKSGGLVEILLHGTLGKESRYQSAQEIADSLKKLEFNKPRTFEAQPTLSLEIPSQFKTRVDLASIAGTYMRMNEEQRAAFVMFGSQGEDVGRSSELYSSFSSDLGAVITQEIESTKMREQVRSQRKAKWIKYLKRGALAAAGAALIGGLGYWGYQKYQEYKLAETGEGVINNFVVPMGKSVFERAKESFMMVNAAPMLQVGYVQGNVGKKLGRFRVLKEMANDVGEYVVGTQKSIGSFLGLLYAKGEKMEQEMRICGIPHANYFPRYFFERNKLSQKRLQCLSQAVAVSSSLVNPIDDVVEVPYKVIVPELWKQGMSWYAMANTELTQWFLKGKTEGLLGSGDSVRVAGKLYGAGEGVVEKVSEAGEISSCGSNYVQDGFVKPMNWGKFVCRVPAVDEKRNCYPTESYLPEQNVLVAQGLLDGCSTKQKLCCPPEYHVTTIPSVRRPVVKKAEKADKEEITLVVEPLEILVHGLKEEYKPGDTLNLTYVLKRGEGFLSTEQCKTGLTFPEHRTDVFSFTSEHTPTLSSLSFFFNPIIPCLLEQKIKGEKYGIRMVCKDTENDEEIEKMVLFKFTGYNNVNCDNEPTLKYCVDPPKCSPSMLSSGDQCNGGKCDLVVFNKKGGNVTCAFNEDAQGFDLKDVLSSSGKKYYALDRSIEATKDVYALSFICSSGDYKTEWGHKVVLTTKTEIETENRTKLCGALFGSEEEYIIRCVASRKDVDFIQRCGEVFTGSVYRLKCIEQFSNKNLVDICASSFVSDIRKYFCIDSYKNTDYIKECVTAFEKDEFRSRCLRGTASQLLVKSCRTVLKEERYRLNCININYDPLLVLACGSTFRADIYRVQCIEAKPSIQLVTACKNTISSEDDRLVCVRSSSIPEVVKECFRFTSNYQISMECIKQGYVGVKTR